MGICAFFQRYALFPHLNVYENIAFGLKLQGIKEKEMDRRVIQALKMVGMSDYEERDVNSLSGGQQQRVAPRVSPSPCGS